MFSQIILVFYSFAYFVAFSSTLRDPPLNTSELSVLWPFVARIRSLPRKCFTLRWSKLFIASLFFLEFWTNGKVCLGNSQLLSFMQGLEESRMRHGRRNWLLLATVTETTTRDTIFLLKLLCIFRAYFSLLDREN